MVAEEAGWLWSRAHGSLAVQAAGDSDLCEVVLRAVHGQREAQAGNWSIILYFFLLMTRVLSCGSGGHSVFLSAVTSVLLAGLAGSSTALCGDIAGPDWWSLGLGGSLRSGILSFTSCSPHTRGQCFAMWVFFHAFPSVACLLCVLVGR